MGKLVGSIRKVGKAYEANAYWQGKRKYRTFRIKSEARAWIDETESKGFSSGITVRKLFDKYLDEVACDKESYTWDRNKLNMIGRMPIGDIRLDKLSSKHISQYKDARLKEVKQSSADREWTLLRTVFNKAKEWELVVDNPMNLVKRPGEGEARDRVITDDEVDKLLFFLGNSLVADIFQFALQTAMRNREICLSTWENVYTTHIHLPAPITKGRRKRDVPLSSEAKEILKRQATKEGLIFPIKNTSVDPIFRKAKKAAGILDVQFRDSRHTALTRLAKVYTNPMDLAKLSGHRDLNILLNTYYNPTIEDLASKLD